MPHPRHVAHPYVEEAGIEEEDSPHAIDATKLLMNEMLRPSKYRAHRSYYDPLQEGLELDRAHI